MKLVEQFLSEESDKQSKQIQTIHFQKKKNERKQFPNLQASDKRRLGIT